MANVVVLFLLSTAGFGQTAKILLISGPMVSHCMQVSAIGNELVKRGHEVTIYLSAIFEHHQCYGSAGIRLMQFNPGPANKTMAAFMVDTTNLLLKGSDISLLWIVGQIQEFTWHLCMSMLWDERAIVRLKRKKFDFVVLNGGFLLYCQFTIPYKLKIPYAAISSYYEDIVIGRPFLPAISPSWSLSYTSDMNLIDRVVNTLYPFMMHLLHIVTFPQDAIDIITPELSRRDVVQLVSRSDLFLQNYDPVLAYPIPNFPNQIMVGGLTTRPAKALPDDLKSYYDNSDGVILVSFGSSFGQLPPVVKQKFVSALKRMKLHILWKDFEDEVDKNIKFVKWLPQNDLLAHPKTRLFVNHCGQNSLFEALYQGVPIVCAPLAGDQFFNAARVKYWNAGKKIDFHHSSAEEIFQIITEVLWNSSYGENMKNASKIFHSQPLHPKERAAYWVEHVLRFGSNHLRSRASEMSVFTLLGYDVLCLFLGMLVISLFIFYKLLYYLCRCCCKQKKSKLKTS